MSLLDLFRAQAITAGQLRQEIYLLGGRHQGDALAGARAELQDGGLTAERRALLRAVESHLASGKSVAVAGETRPAWSSAVYIAVIIGSATWAASVIRSLM